MNEFDIFDAIGGVDEDLLARAETRPARKLPLRKTLIAAAAAALLAVTAVAAPAIADLLFDSNMEQTGEGTVIKGIDGLNVVYADMYQIDFSLEDTENIPATFEEYMIPTYFEEQGWYQDYGYDLTEHNPYPSMEYMWFQRRGVQTWVVFEQAVFHTSGGSDSSLGTGQFFLAVPPDYEAVQETLVIDGQEITSYLVDFSVTLGERHIFWTDGRYAYHLTASKDIEADELGQIITSIVPMESCEAYLKAGEHKVIVEPEPITTYYTLTGIPEDYYPNVCEDMGYAARWVWSNDVSSIRLDQCTYGNISVSISTYEYFGIPHTIEEAQIDGRTVYFVLYENGCTAAWETEADVFILKWEDVSDISIEDMTALMDTLEPVDDISAYITE